MKDGTTLPCQTLKSASVKVHGNHNAGLGGKHTDQRRNKNKIDEAAAVARTAVKGVSIAVGCGGSVKDKGRWACGQPYLIMIPCFES